MKKILLFAGVVIAVMGVIGLAGYTYARAQAAPAPEFSYSDGARSGISAPDIAMGGWGRICPWEDIDGGFMYDYMIEYLADAFNMTPQQLEALHEDGRSMWQIANDLDIHWRAFRELMFEAREYAIEQALEDNVITPTQAERMRLHMQGMLAASAYLGPCNAGPGRFGGRGLAPIQRWDARHFGPDS